MIRKNINNSNGTINHNESYIGETIEQKVERVTTSKEPIEDTAPVIYTERKDGVLPEYNPRTDRFEVALEGMDAAHRSTRAKTMELYKSNLEQSKENNGGAESIQASSTE